MADAYAATATAATLSTLSAFLASRADLPAAVKECLLGYAAEAAGGPAVGEGATAVNPPLRRSFRLSGAAAAPAPPAALPPTALPPLPPHKFTVAILPDSLVDEATSLAAEAEARTLLDFRGQAGRVASTAPRLASSSRPPAGTSPSRWTRALAARPYPPS